MGATSWIIVQRTEHNTVTHGMGRRWTWEKAAHEVQKLPHPRGDVQLEEQDRFIRNLGYSIVDRIPEAPVMRPQRQD